MTTPKRRTGNIRRKRRGEPDRRGREPISPVVSGEDITRDGAAFKAEMERLARADDAGGLTELRLLRSRVAQLEDLLEHTRARLVWHGVSTHEIDYVLHGVKS